MNHFYKCADHKLIPVLFQSYLNNCLTPLLKSTLSAEADIEGGSFGLFGKYTNTSRKTNTAKPHSVKKIYII